MTSLCAVPPKHVRVAVAMIWLSLCMSTMGDCCQLGAHDLSALSPAVLRIPLRRNGAISSNVWWALDLCSNQQNVHPNGTQPCFKGGFVVEYNAQTCATQPFDVLGRVAVVNATAGLMTFGRAENPGWMASVELQCGETASLQSVGFVDATGPPDLLTFNIQLRTSLMC